MSKCLTSVSTTASLWLRLHALCQLFFLAGLVSFSFIGCDSSPVKPQVPAKIDPTKELEWGLFRLDRLLTNFRPDTSTGVNVLERKITHELIPPDSETDYYRAVVTITTTTSFFHKKRESKNDKGSSDKKEDLGIEDPLALKDEEYEDVLNRTDIVPKSPRAPASVLDPVNSKSETVFEMAYLDNRWQLTKGPTEEYKRNWYKYAFE